MFKKAIIIALLMALSMGVVEAGTAEGNRVYWISDDDPLYYHGYRYCQGVEGRRQGEDGWEAEDGRIPCEVCYRDSDKLESPIGVKRGGTFIVKASDDWMRAQDGTAGIIEDEYTYTGVKAHAVLASQLHGTRYVDFAEKVRKDNAAEEQFFSEGFYSHKEGLIMSMRHIDGSWYFAFRPDPQYTGMRYLRFNTGRMTWTGGALTLGAVKECAVPEGRINMKTDGLNVVDHEGASGDLSYTIYDSANGAVCVVHEKGGAKRDPDSVRFRIGGVTTVDTFNGYADGDLAVYVFAMRSSEYTALRQTGKIEIIR